MPTSRGRLTLLVAIAAYVIGWAFGTREAFVFAAGLALAVVVAVVYVRMAAGPFRLDRRLASGHYVAGDDLVFDISVRSIGGRLPAVPAARRAARSGKTTVPLEHLGDRLTARVHLPALPRGRYILGSHSSSSMTRSVLRRAVMPCRGAERSSSTRESSRSIECRGMAAAREASRVS